MLGDIIPLDILSSIWSQCNSCDGGCSAGGITLFSVAIHECRVKLWSLHRVRASLTTVVLSQMQSPYMKRLCTACYRWYTLRKSKHVGPCRTNASATYMLSPTQSNTCSERGHSQTQRVVLAGRSTPCPGKSFQLFGSWFRLLLLTHTTCSWYLVTSYHQVHANKQQLLLLGWAPRRAISWHPAANP